MPKLNGWNDNWTNNDVQMAFSANVLDLRTKAGLTQSALADLIGYTRIAVSNMERNQQGATLPTLLRLAWALDCTPNDLLDRGEHGKARPQPAAVRSRHTQAKQRPGYAAEMKKAAKGEAKRIKSSKAYDESQEPSPTMFKEKGKAKSKASKKKAPKKKVPARKSTRKVGGK